MKKLKNHKGITGIDITASIVVIFIAIGIISTMYSKYINNSKKIKRNTEASNVAMKFIEYIEKTDYDIINNVFEENSTTDKNNNKIYKITVEAEDDLVNIFGLEVKEFVKEIPSGYWIKLNKQDRVSGLSMNINIDAFFNIVDEEEKISFSVTKNKIIPQVNLPYMQDEKIKSASKDEKARYTLKYSQSKGGYIQSKSSDEDWYSISGKRYPMVVYAEQEDFNVNGVMNFENCNEIYVWVPRFGKINENNYGFCYNTTNNRIIYGDTEKKISDTTGEIPIFGYIVDTSEELTEISLEFENATGEWVKVNKDLNPIDDSGNEITSEDNILNILKTKQFTWTKQN